MAKKLALHEIESTKESVEGTEAEASTKIKDYSEFIKSYQNEYEAARQQMSGWKNKQVKLYQQRMGIRPATTYPWAGASSISLPVQDSKIRTLKAEDVGAIWNTFPICDFRPGDNQPLEAAERISWHFDDKVRNEIQPFPEICIAADKRMQEGFTVIKTVYEWVWEPRTIVILREEIEKALEAELKSQDHADILSDPNKIPLLMRAMSAIWGFDPDDTSDALKMMTIANEFYAGTQKFEFTIDELIYKNPKITILNPGEDFTVPSGTDALFDYERAKWIDHKVVWDPEEFWAAAESKKFDKTVARAVLKKYNIDPKDFNKITFKDTKPTAQTAMKSQQDLREGVDRGGSSTSGIPIHEVCMWFDSDGDGKPERHVLWYCEDYNEAPLRFKKYQMNLKRWPYIKIPFEITGYSNLSPRGTTEIQNQIATSLNMQENTKNNRQTLSTTPTLFFNGGKFNPKNMTGIPGQPVSTDGRPSDNVQWMVAPGYDGSFIQEEMYLKNWADEAISGGPDLGNPVNLAGKDKKSQQFLQSISSNHINTRQLDILIWNWGWAKVFENLYYLDLQYGDEEMQSASDADGKPTKINKRSMGGKWKLSCGGKLGVTSPLLEAQKAQARFHELAGNPMVDQRELLREYLDRQDPRISKLLLKPIEQVQAEQQAAQQAAMQQKVMDANLGIVTKAAKKQQSKTVQMITGGAAGALGSRGQKTVGG